MYWKIKNLRQLEEVDHIPEWFGRLALELILCAIRDYLCFPKEKYDQREKDIHKNITGVENKLYRHYKAKLYLFEEYSFEYEYPLTFRNLCELLFIDIKLARKNIIEMWEKSEITLKRGEIDRIMRTRGYTHKKKVAEQIMG